MTFIPAGKIVNTHGVYGEVKIEVWLDSPEFLKSFKRIFLEGKEYRFKRASVHKGFLLAALEGIDSMDSAIALKGKEISILRSDARLPKGKFFLCEIMGARAFDAEGNEIGILTEIIENPAQPIYVIKGEREHLIPAVEEFILSTDVENKIIRINLIEGM